MIRQQSQKVDYKATWIYLRIIPSRGVGATSALPCNVFANTAGLDWCQATGTWYAFMIFTNTNTRGFRIKVRGAIKSGTFVEGLDWIASDWISKNKKKERGFQCSKDQKTYGSVHPGLSEQAGAPGLPGQKSAGSPHWSQTTALIQWKAPLVLAKMLSYLWFLAHSRFPSMEDIPTRMSLFPLRTTSGPPESP